MANNPLVSILIPTYNQAEYLGAAIDSALAQTYPHIEIIIHNDASTDKTSVVLAKYRKVKKVKIVETKDNHGMIGGWNYIASLARGKYLKYIASDDLLAPSCVEQMVDALERNKNCALVTCRRRFIDSQGREKMILGMADSSSLISGLDYGRSVLQNIRENKIGEPTAVMYRRQLISKAGEYDPQFSQFADFEYWLRLTAEGDIYYLNQTLCAFRVHDSSNTSRAIADGRFIPEIFALIRKYYESPRYRKVYSLTDRDREAVTRQKSLDTLKNIKDLYLERRYSQAANYFARLRKEVKLGYMTQISFSYLLSK